VKAEQSQGEEIANAIGHGFGFAVSLAAAPILVAHSVAQGSVAHGAWGWTLLGLIVVAARPLLLRLPPAGVAWLVLGGVAYTAGVAFYAARRLPYGHFVWHVFVLVGTTCHYFAVMWYAA
jgi:hemolysin III